MRGYLNSRESIRCLKNQPYLSSMLRPSGCLGRYFNSLQMEGASALYNHPYHNQMIGLGYLLRGYLNSGALPQIAVVLSHM